MSITPTPFGTGGAEDNPDFLTSSSPASGPEGVAEELDKLGTIARGTQDRVVADEAVTAGIVSADVLGTANNPVTSSVAQRPTGLAVVYWYTATQPVNWQVGDVWDNTTAIAVSGAALAAANGSDFADAGSERYNTHVPALTPAACVSVTNIASLIGNAAIDGYTPAATDLVLLTGQSTASLNGLWLIPTGGGAWTRPTEFPTGGVVKGRTCRVLNGTNYQGTEWTLQAPTGGITVGTTAQTWLPMFASTPLIIPSTGAPAGTVGYNGDYTFDLATGFFYGPKAAGAFPSTPIKKVAVAQPTVTTADSSSGVHTGTFSGATLPSLLVGQFSNAVTLPSTSGAPACVDFGGTVIPTGTAFTVECWFQAATAGNNGNLVSKFTSGTADFFRLYITGAQLSGQFTTSAGDVFPSSGLTLADTSWHHALMSWDGTNVRLFQDGVLKSTAALAGTIVANNAAVHTVVGADSGSPNTNGFVGLIDEVRLSSTARFTAGFTPAVSAYTSDGSTLLLAHMDSVTIS